MKDKDYIDIAHELEIADRQRVHIVDNGASQQILDQEMFVGDGSDSAFPTDWEHDLEQLEKSNYGPNGEVLDDMDQKFHLRKIQEAEAKEEGPKAACVSPSSWDKGVLGGTVIAQPNQNTALAGNIEALVFWPGDDRESCPVTITIGRQLLPTPVAATGVIRPVARILWGTRNGQFTADIDIGAGCELTIEASSVYVNVYLDAGSTISCQLFASIGFYTATRTSPVLKTEYIAAQGSGAGGAVTINRPLFASSLYGHEKDDPNVVGVGYVIDFLDLNANIVGSRTFAAGAYLDTPIPLANDIAAVRVTYNGGNPTSTSRLVWGLF